MKNFIKFIMFALVLTTAFTACKKDTGVEAEVKEAEEVVETEATAADANYNVTKGVITWTGNKPVGDGHTGTLRVKSGQITTKDGNIASGTFVLDMNSISNIDLSEKPEKKAQLEGHLKEDDFFGVEDYPTATFQLTNAAPLEGNPDATHTITGNLTIRGISKSISFPAHVSIMDNKITAVTPKFSIDRTNWGVNYNSTALKTAQDKLINDKIALVLELDAQKQS